VGDLSKEMSLNYRFLFIQNIIGGLLQMKHKKKLENQEKYSDLILVDLLHPDWKHFFTRYRTDLVGFIIFVILMVMIMVGTYFLKNIGS